jgi:hypothetical protein
MATQVGDGRVGLIPPTVAPPVAGEVTRRPRASEAPPADQATPSPAAAPPGRLSVRQHALVLAGSLLLVVLFTYPLARDPGHLLPFHKDPMMYAWTMVSNTHRLLSAPLTVFHGNTFYPHGNVVAHSDLLLTPTLFPAGPIYLLTGNPILQYNLTLLAWWALSGWAMYVLTFALLRSHGAAVIAAIVFTLCPFRTDFFLEFQMQLAFPIPLAVLALLRFLETQRGRYLAGALALVWIEALASMYYALILGLCMVVLVALHAILRGHTWRRALVLKGAVGVIALGLAMAPFLVPYAENRSELGLVRPLDQPQNKAADILTYFETGVTRLYRLSPSGHIAETSIFLGFVGLALAAVGLGVRAGPEVPAAPPVLRAARTGLTVGLLAVSTALVVTLVARGPLHAARMHFPPPFGFFMLGLLLGLARFALEGWWAARRREGAAFGERELRWVSVFLLGLFFLLSLGPEIHYAREPLGRGLYAYLYPYLLPLQAMRVTSRIGIVVVLAVALLAGMGTKLVEARLGSVRWRAAIVGVLALALLAEYAPFPLPYQWLDWRQPPPVYRALAADPADVAVLEWPQNIEDYDDFFTLMSINHWKRIVNGASGFSPMGPKMSVEISAALSEPGTPSDPFPTVEARRFLLGIHPLRYVVVHNDIIPPAEEQKWQRLPELPGARLVARFGRDDVYRLTGEMKGWMLEKYFSWDYARGKTTVTFEARAFGSGADTSWIEMELNGQRLGRQTLGSGWMPITLPLVGRRFHSAPNVVAIHYHYRPTNIPDGRPIGRTGGASPADLTVVSGGKEVGYVGWVIVNGDQVARNRRGYNLVAVDPTSGRVLRSDVFDTFASPGESHRLAEAIRELPAGTVVAATVKDDGAGNLTDEAVAALRSLGGSADIRGRYRTSHALIGVKGAAPGTAVERSGYDRLTLSVGTPQAELGVEIREFDLR